MSARIITLPEPPYNLQAEQAFLGALLANNSVYSLVSNFLLPDHFADPIHAKIFAACVSRIDRGAVADMISLKGDLENSGILSEVGGIAYLAQLVSAMVGLMNAGEYGRVITEAWQRRKVIDAAEAAMMMAYDGSVQLQEAVSLIENLEFVADEGSKPKKAVSLISAVDDALAAADRVAKGDDGNRVKTGFLAIDEALGGLEPGTLTVLGGRPAMGKSALGYQIGLNVARSIFWRERSRIDAGDAPNAHIPRVGVFSLEMSAAELGRRALSAASGVALAKLKRGQHEKHMDALIAARKELASLPLIIDDSAGLTAGQISSKVRKHARKAPFRLIVIDHLHIVTPSEQSQRSGASFGIGEITRSLKRLAKELETPILLLAQLSRGVESRDDKRPLLSDLKQAGDIEQDADTVMFVYRPEYYLPKAPPEKAANETEEKHSHRVNDYHTRKQALAGRAEVIIAKQRDGAECVVPLMFRGYTTSFYEEVL